MNKIFYIVIIASFLFGCSYSESETEQAHRLTDSYQLEIKAGDPSLFYPKGFTKVDAQLSNVEMKETSLEDASEALDGIEAALAIYPAGFVSSLIDAIYISGPMKIEGAEAGGTYAVKWIILANVANWNGTQANYENALRGVHHELSSLVYRDSIFISIAWAKLLPQNWTPATSNFEALTEDVNLLPAYNAGFLSGYAKSSMGNDFNIYAEFAFAEPESLRTLAQKYPIIAKKLGVFISAYTHISPKFSRAFDAYFIKTGLKQVAIITEKAEISFNVNIDNVKAELQ